MPRRFSRSRFSRKYVSGTPGNAFSFEFRSRAGGTPVCVRGAEGVVLGGLAARFASGCHSMPAPPPPRPRGDPFAQTTPTHLKFVMKYSFTKWSRPLIRPPLTLGQRGARQKQGKKLKKLRPARRRRVGGVSGASATVQSTLVELIVPPTCRAGANSGWLQAACSRASFLWSREVGGAHAPFPCGH